MGIDYIKSTKTNRDGANFIFYKDSISEENKLAESGVILQPDNAKLMKGKKTVTVSASRKAKTIKRLSAKKTYYVRVKAYKVVDNEKVYTAYSAKKKVRTK